MKVLIFLGLCFLVQFAQAKLEEPFISVMRGAVEVVDFRNEVMPKPLYKTLKENVEIKTQQDSQVRVELEKDSWVIVLANSHIVLQIGTWEKLNYRGIQIKQGSIRIIRKVQEGAGLQRYQVQTQLTDLAFLNGDAIFNYDANGALSEVIVNEGQIDFMGLGRDEVELVKAGQRIGFKGLKEDGEISYDLLLQGRKVARGKYLPLQKLQGKEGELFQKLTNIPKPKNLHLVSKPVKKPGEICEKPFGKFNECSWTCENSRNKGQCEVGPKTRCIRRKCDANGRWSDPIEQPVGACVGLVNVKKCDY